ncbi:extracellular solute-binding protein [Photobacterium sp. 1_MG-2023]|uniref:extracellular solute-binding protein n=1 Tax=Photobacterium sp. 1_MG-2023 TaxID=3062646 RepID=UPI0026E2CF4C|nr:extracellular solute-binding protein [Photobacterium sp. 1_MG-2023]MDO6707837.1 extracellular solute-binding protein [Photobacterium sp. 1_MG-2023]
MKKTMSLSALLAMTFGSSLLMAADLPADLNWQSNLHEPRFASPQAKFGGTFHTYIESFPQTFRVVGPDSNGRFRPWLLDSRPSAVTRHPDTKAWIPDIASEWAYGDDNKTVYFRINPNAKWSDGEPITSEDFTFVLTFMRSKDIVAPWYNTFYTQQIEDVIQYDERTFAVVSGEKRNAEELMLYTNMRPIPAHFYRPKKDENHDGIQDNFVRFYNFKPEPSAGPYYVDDMKKGKSITFKHVGKDWWGYSNPYYLHRYNVEKIRIKVIRDKDIARQHFEKGNLDSFWLDTPELWREKTETANFEQGYIHKFWGYNQVPIGAGGLWLNTAKPLLDQLEVRKGIALATDFDGLIEKVLRGDVVRKPNPMGIGHGDYTNADIKAPSFDPAKAIAHFEKAGFSQIGPDGIRVNEQGQRLSFGITYSYGYLTPQIAYLKEQAKLAGLEFTLNLIDGSSAFKYVLEKKHELSFHSMGTAEIPAYWEYFHSTNANKPQNNNFTNFSTPELDRLIMAYRTEFDLEKKKVHAKQIQAIVADAGVIVPGYMRPYAREAFWRWLQIPQPAMTKSTEFLFPSGTFRDLGTYWIDESLKKETKAAMKSGKSFAPVTILEEEYKL